MLQEETGSSLSRSDSNRATPIKVVLFDLDETLFDHAYSSRMGLKIIREFFPGLQTEPLEVLEKVFSEILEELHPQVLAGRITPDEARIERIRRLLKSRDIRPRDADIHTVTDRYREQYQRSRRPIAGIPSLLSHLRSQVEFIGVVTNNFTLEQREKLRVCGIDHLVHFLVTAEDVGIPKPSPAMFEAALQKAQASPAEAVMVGDSWESDVLGARQSGIRPVWFNRAGIDAPEPVTQLREFLPTERVARILLEGT